MAESMQEENMGISYQEQRDQPQNSLEKDRGRNQSPRVHVSQKNTCKVCNDKICKMDIHKVESLLQIPLDLRYFVEEDHIHNIKSAFHCNLHELIVWKYLMNSPLQCLKYSTYFSSERINVTILNSGSVAINSPVINESHAVDITGQILKNVFVKLGPILTVETVCTQGGIIEDNVRKLNELFGQEIAYAFEVEKRILIVFPNSGKEVVAKCIQEYMHASQGKEITQTVILEHIFKNFQKEIVKCLINASIALTFEEVDGQFICKLSGPKIHVEPAVRQLEQMKSDLNYKDVHLSSQRKRTALNHVNVEDRINDLIKARFSSCVLEQTKNYLRVYSFKSSMLSDATCFVENLISDRIFQMQGNARQQTGEIVRHLQSKYEGKMIVDADDKCRLFLFGLRPDVDEAFSELVDIQEGRISLDLAMLDESSRINYSEEYEVRKIDHLKYLQNSIFIEKIEDTFNVKICFDPKRYILEITGSEKDVKSAVTCVKKIGKCLISDSYIVPQKAAVHFFESESCRDFIRSVERESDVSIEKQSETIFGNEKMQVTKIEHNDYSQWTVSEDRSLFLEQCSLEKVITDVKIIPSRQDPHQNASTPIVKGQHIVHLSMPDWIDGSQTHSGCDHYKENLKKIFQELHKTGEKSVMISLNYMGEWMPYTIEFVVKWLLSGPFKRPTKVRLCPGEEGFSATDVLIDKCLENMISDIQNKDGLCVTVCKGELDKMEADVLVNTAAANLDLSRGNVSAALLKTAGHDLQKECSKRYHNGIGHGEIAITGGHRAACTNIYHIALKPFSEKAMKDCIEDLRKAMSQCLHTASDNGHTTIAFPAMGTGSLGYPVELIAAEMFGSVERYKIDCPHTMLKAIYFVIFHRDDELFQYFKEIETRDVKPTGRHRQIRIEILGTKENVNYSRELLDAKVQEFHKLPATTDKQGNASHTKQKPPSSESLDILPGKSRDGDKFVKSTLGSQRSQITYERTFSWSKDAEHVEVFECNQCFVRTYIGDIMYAPVECIVSTSTEGIKQGPDSNSTTRRKVKEEINCWIQKNGQTGPEFIPIGKCVMNAIFPCWDTYKPMTRSNLKKCTKYVRRTVEDCLQLAEDRNIRSIAFPSICSELFGIPQDVCAIQFAEAVKAFTKSSNTVKEIHFIDNNLDMVEIIQKTFKTMICDGKQAPYNTDIYLETSSIDEVGTSAKEKYGASAKCKNNKHIKNIEGNKPKYIPLRQEMTSETITQEVARSHVTDNNPIKCIFSSGNIVEVYEGDILSIPDVEAIVCSENRRGQAKGQIANALFRDGDDRYRDAKEKEFCRSTKYGDVITTLAGEAWQFKWVLHAIVPRRSNDINIIYREVFKEVQNRNIISLALPLLGTGKADMDPISSANILLSEVAHFFNQNYQHTFRVHIVLNDPQITTVVKDLFKTFVDDIKKPHESKFKQRIQPEVEIVESQKDEEGTKEMKNKSKTQFGASTINSASKAKEEPIDDCVICMDNVSDAMKLVCGHIFCRECIEGYFRVKKVCPTCGKVCGVITGDQPDGKMEVVKRNTQLGGYHGYKSIAITYSFPPGKQGADHPRPGAQYQGINRTAYLPDNMEGREICTLLKVAFERRLVFTIGTSRTTGQEGVITWNDIHHKTDVRPNTQFGYPDNTYLQRVREELEVKGVTKDDIDTKLMKKLDKDNFRPTTF